MIHSIYCDTHVWALVRHLPGLFSHLFLFIHLLLVFLSMMAVVEDFLDVTTAQKSRIMTYHTSLLFNHSVTQKLAINSLNRVPLEIL